MANYLYWKLVVGYIVHAFISMFTSRYVLKRDDLRIDNSR